jgi:hypothetical protein
MILSSFFPLRRVSAGGGVGSAPVAAGKNGTTPARNCVARAEKFKKQSGGTHIERTTTVTRFGVFLVHFLAFLGPVCRVGVVGWLRGVPAVFCSFKARK